MSSRAPTGSVRPFEDFLPQDDFTPPASTDRSADKPQRSDPERPPATAERPDTAPRTDRPDDRSDDRDDARSADAAAPATVTPPPAEESTARSGTAAGTSEEMTTAEPAMPLAGAAPSGQAAAPTAAAPNAERAPSPGIDIPAGMQAAAAPDKATPGTKPGTPPSASQATAQPQNAPTPPDGAEPMLQTLPADATGTDADATAPTPAKDGLVTGAAARIAAQQIGEATRSAGADSGTGSNAGARNGSSAQPAQAGAQRPATPTDPAIAQAMDSSDEPGSSPDALTFTSIGDGDLSSAATGQSPAGTPSSLAQAAHGAAAGGHRPVPTAPMLAEQIAVHIQRGMEQGTDRIDIRLTPAELGRIEVRLEVRHDGRVHAAIAVDRAETLDLLQRDARSLERALQDAGLKTDSGGLTFNLRGDGGQQFNTGFAANEAFAGNGPERSEPDTVADAGQQRLRLDGVVDIRV